MNRERHKTPEANGQTWPIHTVECDSATKSNDALTRYDGGGGGDPEKQDAERGRTQKATYCDPTDMNVPTVKAIETKTR